MRLLMKKDVTVMTKRGHFYAAVKKGDQLFDEDVHQEGSPDDIMGMGMGMDTIVDNNNTNEGTFVPIPQADIEKIKTPELKE
eukprot:8843426-Ditylum_brightwellii.AAC.1